MSREDVLAWIDQLARFHLVECLIQHARDAHTRFFGTTGMPFLDDNGPGSGTTKASVIKKMLKQMSVLDRALELYGRRGTIPLTDRRARLITDNISLDDALELKSALAEHFIDHNGEVKASLKRLGKQIGRYKGALKRLKSDKTFLEQGAWQGRGPHPLQMLWLNISFAAGWLELPKLKREVNQDEGEILAGWISKGEGNTATRMHEALWAATLHKPLLGPRLRRKDWVRVAQRLFFLLRHGVVQDPDSKIVAELRLQPDLKNLFDILQRRYAEKQRQKARKEALSYDSAEDAEGWYDDASSRCDRISRSLKDEAHGFISFRLRS